MNNKTCYLVSFLFLIFLTLIPFCNAINQYYPKEGQKYQYDFELSVYYLNKTETNGPYLAVTDSSKDLYLLLDPQEYDPEEETIVGWGNIYSRTLELKKNPNPEWLNYTTKHLFRLNNGTELDLGYGNFFKTSGFTSSIKEYVIISKLNRSVLRQDPMYSEPVPMANSLWIYNNLTDNSIIDGYNVSLVDTGFKLTRTLSFINTSKYYDQTGLLIEYIDIFNLTTSPSVDTVQIKFIINHSTISGFSESFLFLCFFCGIYITVKNRNNIFKKYS